MSRKILIIDDEPDFVSTIKLRLEANYYTVVTASDGEEGYHKIIEEKPDLILLDIMMPRKDGFTLLRDIKKNEVIKDIPVIVLTAKPEMKELFEPEGIKCYLTKPFDPDDLLKNIRKSLEQ